MFVLPTLLNWLSDAAARPAKEIRWRDHVVDATHAAVLLEAHRLRVARGDHHIDRIHVADAIEALATRTTDSLSGDRSPKDPYR